MQVLHKPPPAASRPAQCIVPNAAASSQCRLQNGGRKPLRCLPAPQPAPLAAAAVAAARKPAGSGHPQVACTAAAGTPGPLHWLRSEMGTRLGVTLLLIVLARVGHFVPLPGVLRMADGSHAAMELLMGRSEVVANVFMLGIAPLMSAYFTLGVCNIVPSIRKHFAELREAGPRGRDIYNSYASSLFVIFAFSEAIPLARGWLPAGTGWAARTGFVLWNTVVMTAGAAICKHITQMVEQHGLGDGTGLMIALGVAASYAHYLLAVAQHLMASPPAPLSALLVVVMCFCLVVVSIWAQATQLHLPITFYRAQHTEKKSEHPLLKLLSSSPKQQGRRQPEQNQEDELVQQQQQQGRREAGRQLYFPLKLSPSGARSLLFANFWVALLKPPFSWLGLPNPFDSALGFAALVLFVEGISFADMTPRQISQFLIGSDAGIRGVSPGEATIKFLTAKRQQLKLLNAALLAALSLAARAVDAASAALLGVPIGCLSLLLLASTVAAGIRQVEALSRAPLMDRLVAREEAAVGWRSSLKIVMPEARWNS